MGTLISLNEVNATVLPGRVLVLLSKYAQELRKHTGLVIKVSSMNVFKHVDKTRRFTESSHIHKVYKELLIEVNQQLALGSMQTHAQRQLSDLTKQNMNKTDPYLNELMGSSNSEFSYAAN